ncbi:hypothetical protein HBH64_212460 [Parastagonospora nodorum]|nr:hypothetical protein HBH51_104590 [Parastagonospora nodorum]KAH4287805.1 hypothetical protein HBI02_214810 [Parastagonospora nodorum]KAH4288895.1 hypothetical protein HBI01_217580 [Parastagonospora nodorum]KAH4320661.1 hypothetical protein HBI00_222440 [Parastagonospora nodorum]KAH4360391.1 hypothetical protein HBH94_194160 [Parastagonospora nodorum]
MESVAILGVVGNAIQLVDFTTKLVSKSRSLQHSGSLVEQEDLLTVSKDLSQLSASLKRDLELAPAGNTENDIATRSICEKCFDIGLEIEIALADTNKKSSYGKWKSFRHALKAIWGAEKLADMQGRLTMFSQQLQQRTQMKTHEAVTDMHVDVIRALNDATISSTKEHEATRSDIQSLQSEAERQAHQLREEINTLRSDLEKRIAESVVKSEQLSKTEQNRLHQFTNATYKLWAAKEVMLANISSTIDGLREVTRSKSAVLSKAGDFKLHAYPSYLRRGDQTAMSTGTSTQKIAGSQPGPRIPVDDFPAATPCPLCNHIAVGNVQGLAACLVAGADVNAQCRHVDHDMRASTPRRITPLIAALCKEVERVEIIEVLLKHGADPSGCDSNGLSAYHYALRTEDPDTVRIVVRALSEAQRDTVASPSSRSNTSLRRQEPTKVSIAWDTVLAFISGDGSEPHKLAFQVSSLLHAGCLHLAVIFGHVEAADIFMSLGLSPYLRYSFHAPALAIALRNGYGEIASRMSKSRQKVSRDEVWYKEIFDESYGPDYSFIDFIEAILDVIPLEEGLHHAIRLKSYGWAQRIINALIPELIPEFDRWNLDVTKAPFAADLDRKKSWNLIEAAFDKRLCRSWIFGLKLPHELCKIPGLSVAFAKKIIGWIDDSPTVAKFHTQRFRRTLVKHTTANGLMGTFTALYRDIPTRDHLWSNESYYTNWVQNMYPASTYPCPGSETVSTDTEHDRINKQMALLLMRAEQKTIPDAHCATFRIDITEDTEWDLSMQEEKDVDETSCGNFSVGRERRRREIELGGS